jgi:hypothetical protein
MLALFLLACYLIQFSLLRFLFNISTFAQLLISFLVVESDTKFVFTITVYGIVTRFIFSINEYVFSTYGMNVAREFLLILNEPILSRVLINSIYYISHTVS